MPRLDGGIQYAAAPRFKHNGLWTTGSPAFAGDDNEYVVAKQYKNAAHPAAGSALSGDAPHGRSPEASPIRRPGM
jgi:hypothetical protein